MVDSDKKGKRSWFGRHPIITVFLVLVLIGWLTSLYSSPKTVKNPRPNNQLIESLPHFEVGYIRHGCGTEYCSLDLVLLINKNLTKDDAWKIIKSYKNQYPEASGYKHVTIDMTCDPNYSTEEFRKIKMKAEDWIQKEEEYTQHLLYSYIYNGEKEYFDAIGDQTQITFEKNATYGIACK